MSLQGLKGVVVGDGGVGKTSFLLTWITDMFPAVYTPSVLGNEFRSIMVDGKPIFAYLFDTVGQEDYDRLRPLSYPQTEVFMVCFSVDSMTSFTNVREKWVPEVKHYCPGTPIVLVGMKSDLRESDQLDASSGGGGVGGADVSSRRERSREFVTPEQAREMAKEIGAVGYYETSALARHGVQDTVMATVRAGLSGSGSGSKGAGRGRRIFRWPWRKSSKNVSGDSDPGVPAPPELPANKEAPSINIPSSTFALDWAKLINKPQHSDVTFDLGHTTFHAHRYVLCSNSDLFRVIFGVSLPAKVKVQSLPRCSGWSRKKLERVAKERKGGREPKGILAVQERQNSSGTVTTITLDPTLFTEKILSRCLSFLYTGTVEDLNKDSEHLQETIYAARLLNLPELELICKNAEKGEESLNPNISTSLNNRNSKVAKSLFLNKSLLSDVSFRVEGSLVHAHKAVLCQRCDVMAAMLTGGFRESQSNEIEIPGVSLEAFLAFLEYLYSDHAPIEKGDSICILELANRYVMPRLMALCELYVSKEVERVTSASIAQAEVDIIALLLTAQLHNASQLSSWCLHFISSNYLAFHQLESFSLLTGDNHRYVTEHRWPPVSYEEAMEEWRAKYGGEGEEGEEEGGGGKSKKSFLMRILRRTGERVS